ncbi:MAG: hypothetical protein V7K41_02730 [Nostoc sp.]|uniref:hypothetical protein n=1 Tax=Nostoc sp. TaxID=1180 RepID=UPI002FF92B19
MLQIHENCCNEILSFNDRKFMLWGGDVRKAIAIRESTVSEHLLSHSDFVETAESLP